MRAPRITQPPRRILVPVEDADLAIHRPRRAPVAVRVERNRLHQILVAVLQVQVKGLVVVVGGGLWDGGCHVLFGEKRTQSTEAKRCQVVVSTTLKECSKMVCQCVVLYFSDYRIGGYNLLGQWPGMACESGCNWKVYLSQSWSRLKLEVTWRG